MKKRNILAITLLCIGINLSKAQQLTTLYNFIKTDSVSSIQPVQPDGKVIVIGNVIYGMTITGGKMGVGTIYSIHTDGTAYQLMHDFKIADGQWPNGFLTPSGNILFGETSKGGANNGGTIFSIHTDGTGFRTLYNLPTTPCPYFNGSLLLIGGTLYGMTNDGGAYTTGNVFSIDTNGTGYTDMHDFNWPGGALPVGSLVAIGNTLYGFTSGYGTNYYGSIFSIQTNGTGFKNLFDFADTNGSFPQSNLVVLGNKLYGMTSRGGSSGPLGDGNIFCINANGSGFKDLFHFTSATTGSNPVWSLTLSGGLLFGTTNGGGSKGRGNIFAIDTTGNNFQELFGFDGSDSLGGSPQDITFSGGYWYGMTASGGADSNGTIFKFHDPLPASIEDLHVSKIDNMAIFPNPASSCLHFTVNSTIAYLVEISIIDILGKTVLKETGTLKAGMNSFSTNISELRSGTYILKITSLADNSVTGKKFVVR